MSPAATHYRRGRVVDALRLQLVKMKRAEEEMHTYAKLVSENPNIDFYAEMLHEYTCKYKVYMSILQDMAHALEIPWTEVVGE